MGKITHKGAGRNAPALVWESNTNFHLYRPTEEAKTNEWHMKEGAWCTIVTTTHAWRRNVYTRLGRQIASCEIATKINSTTRGEHEVCLLVWHKHENKYTPQLKNCHNGGTSSYVVWPCERRERRLVALIKAPPQDSLLWC